MRPWDKIFLKTVLIIFKLLDVFDLILRKTQDLKATMAQQSCQFSIPRGLAPPSEAQLSSLLEDLGADAPDYTLPADNMLSDPAILEFMPSQGGPIFGPAAAKKYFHECLSLQGASSEPKLDDVITRQTANLTEDAAKQYIKAFADGVLAARQVSLDVSLKQGMNSLNQAISKLTGIKLNLPDKVEEIISRSEKRIIDTLTGKVQQAPPAYDQKLHEEMVLALKFPPKTIRQPGIMKAVIEGFSRETASDIIAGAASQEMVQRATAKMIHIVKRTISSSPAPGASAQSA
ncbi:TPA_asm: P [Pentaphragma betacytorhabdovirus 1]|nr:TPA_asm: P [Pentaphragma betacytorhabdovirus 1]